MSRAARRLRSLGATLRAFTFYLGNPVSSILAILFILSTERLPVSSKHESQTIHNYVFRL
jgi:hypothetical protein